MDPLEKKKILAELGDIPEEVYDDLARVFIGQLAGRVPELGQALRSGNREDLKKMAHTLKGTSGNLRLHKVYAITVELNDIAKNDDAKPRIEELIKALEVCVGELKEEFNCP